MLTHLGLNFTLTTFVNVQLCCVHPTIERGESVRPVNIKYTVSSYPHYFQTISVMLYLTWNVQRILRDKETSRHYTLYSAIHFNHY